MTPSHVGIPLQSGGANRLDSDTERHHERRTRPSAASAPTHTIMTLLELLEPRHRFLLHVQPAVAERRPPALRAHNGSKKKMASE
jgi:hypothetical protein